MLGCRNIKNSYHTLMKIQIDSLFTSVFFVFLASLVIAQFNEMACVYALPEKELFIKVLQKTSPHWMEKQIREDFAPYKNGIPLNIFDDLYSVLEPELFQLVRFKVKDNQLSVDNTYDWLKRSHFIQKALIFLIETVGLPDIDFVMTMHDGFDVPFYFKEQPGHNPAPFIKKPILTFAKSKKTGNGILIPDFEALSDQRTNYSEKNLHVYSWKDKEKKAFWRGSTTGRKYKKDNWFLIPRARLTLLSLQNPDLLDAKFTGVTQPPYLSEEGVEEMISTNNLLTSFTSIDEHLKYRYLIDIDGNSCSYSRPYWILLSNSLLLKHESDEMQWYYKGLKPYQHYVPFKSDFSDIFEKIEWAKNHDLEAIKITKQATEFAKDFLSIEQTYLYFYKVLLNYARLQHKTINLLTPPKVAI